MSAEFTDKKIKILVCEADTRVLKRLELWIKAMGNEPISTDDGIMAKRLFEDHKPDVLLISQNINNIGAIEFIEHIKNSNPFQIVVFMLNSDVETSIFKQSIELNVDRYLNKPVDAQALFNTIDFFLKFYYNK